MKKQIAIVFGTFAPLHQGHIDLIQKAKRSYDKVRVVVSGYQGDRGEEVGLSLQKRFRYTRETFADDELTQVYRLDETSFPRYPLGWAQWLPALLDLVGYDSEGEELIFFVGESDYQAELTKRGFKTSFEERQFGISATMIRENPSLYWKYIAQPFRRHFTKKVLIMGSASNGKTTLAKDLARFYDAPVSLEYAREYQIQNNVRDDELTPKDYYYLLLGQYAQTSRLIDSSANRGLVVADTNSLVTKAYYDYYLKESPVQDEETDTFDNLFASILAKDLARYYDAPVSLEYAREYQIQNNVRDDELTPKDYYYLLLGQYAQTSRLIDSNANRGLVVADTNSLVTKAYYDYYLKESPVQDEETDTFDNLFVSILSKEKWDLILFAEPVGTYVNDGFRDMSMADEAIRSDFSSYLKKLKEQYLPDHPTVYLAGSYLDNYQAAKEAINRIYQAD